MLMLVNKEEKKCVVKKSEIKQIKRYVSVSKWKKLLHQILNHWSE